MPRTATSRLPAATVVRYAIGSIGTGGFGTLPGLVLVFYMTDTLGIAAWTAGIVITAAKIWDVVIDPVITALLRSSGTTSDVDRFPENIEDILALLHPEGAQLRLASGQEYRITATPAGDGGPTVWLLGSSDYSARLAARLGLPFVFANHFGTPGLQRALELYRTGFRPSPEHPEPVTMLTLNAIVAETGQTGFHFVDEAAPPKSLKALAAELQRRGVAVGWWGNIRFEKSFTPELCRQLAASGCIAVSGGLEVASDRLLKLMQKGVSVQQVARVTKAFADAGILVHAYLMYGFPTQTVQFEGPLMRALVEKTAAAPVAPAPNA